MLLQACYFPLLIFVDNIVYFIIIFFFCSQAAQGAVRLEGDVITAHGSVSSLPMGTMMATSMGGRGRGRGSSSPADNASVCTCTCTRPRSRNDGYRSGSLAYASGSIYDSGRGIGDADEDDGGGVGGFDDGDECDVQNIRLETFYDVYPSPVDPYSCRQRVVQTSHRSSI